MSLLSAINDKYSINEEDLQTSIIKFNQKDLNKAKAYFSRIPESVTLQNRGINSIGNIEEVIDLCKNLKTLDIAGNEVASWDHILLIFNCLPSLEVLNISQNPLSGEFPNPRGTVATNIKTLILNHINVSWCEINQLQQALPSLEELHFSLANKSNISFEACQWPSVKCLHSSSSGLSTFEDLHALGRMFPNLQSLTIVENPISSFGENTETWFPELICLNMSKTGVSDWIELEKLRKLPKLCELRIKDIPLIQDLKEDRRRQHTIARLPMVKTLNGSSVTETQREAAERAFLRFYLSRDDKPARFDELHEIHKDIKPLADIDLSPVNEITCMISYEKKREMRKVNVKMTVTEFKKSLQEFVGLPLNEFRILHDLNHLRNGNKKLYTFVHDGDEFLCQYWKKRTSPPRFKSRNLRP